MEIKEVYPQTDDQLMPTPAVCSEEFMQESDKQCVFPYVVFMLLHAGALFFLLALEHSRFEWMVEETQKLWIGLAVGVGYAALYKRARLWWCFALSGICLLIPFTSVFAGFINGPAMLNETHYAMIDQIPWDDKDYLQQHGFENDGTWYTEIELERWDLEKDEAVYYSLDIWVRSIDDGSLDLSRYDVHYGDIYIDEYIFSVEYEDVFSEWLREPCYVNRALYVIANGKEIAIWERDETTPFDIARLESILKALATNDDAAKTSANP